MPGLLIDGKTVIVPDLSIINCKDNPILALKPTDMRARITPWVRSIGIHTTKGFWPQTIKPNYGPFNDVGKKVAKYWSMDPSHTGAHLVVDWDGAITCHCDLLLDAAYHAGTANEWSIGIEIFQGNLKTGGLLYEGQLETVIKLIEWLTSYFSIQRQTFKPGDYKRSKVFKNYGGKFFVGVFGHRHQTLTRGRGDPGDAIFSMLVTAGYETFDYEAEEDRTVWKTRQRDLGMRGQQLDGIPGPSTIRALMTAGHTTGLWLT